MIVYTEVRYDTYVGFISSIHTEQMPYSNIKFTFDDDGKLIDAEFIKEKLNKEWVGLSDDENEAIIDSIWVWGNDFPYDEYRVCIEQALRNKNGF